MTWCKLTVDVDVDFDECRFSGGEIAVALLQNVQGFKFVDNVDLQTTPSGVSP